MIVCHYVLIDRAASTKKTWSGGLGLHVEQENKKQHVEHEGVPAFISNTLTISDTFIDGMTRL